jgi:hypothetical protein
MQCNVCGLEYGMSHNCPGPITSASVLETLDAALKPRADGGIGYYLGEGLKIVRWDDVAIRRNARDPRATFFAVPIWLVAIAVVVLGTILPAMSNAIPRTNNAMFLVGLVVGLIFAFVAAACITFIQLGLCHLIAKWFFGAKGRFIEVMRPLLLGWFVNILAVIPVAGTLLAAIGWTAVLMMVFEEVDEIGRMQAFGIAVGINICIFAIQFALMPVKHHL